MICWLYACREFQRPPLEWIRRVQHQPAFQRRPIQFLQNSQGIVDSTAYQQRLALLGLLSSLFQILQEKGEDPLEHPLYHQILQAAYQEIRDPETFYADEMDAYHIQKETSEIYRCFKKKHSQKLERSFRKQMLEEGWEISVLEEKPSFDAPTVKKDSYGFVAYHPHKRRLVLTIRGTRFPHEWVQDILGGLGRIHGHHPFFETYAKYVYRACLTAIEQYRGKVDKIIITGHSLGGAAAYLIAHRLVDRGHVGLSSIMLRTFSAPLTFLMSAKDFMEKEHAFFDRHNHFMDALHILHKYDLLSPISEDTKQALGNVLVMRKHHAPFLEALKNPMHMQRHRITSYHDAVPLLFSPFRVGLSCRKWSFIQAVLTHPQRPPMFLTWKACSTKA